MTKRPRKCARCRRPLRQPARGRPRRYCSANCRQRAYEQRRKTPQRKLKSDIAASLDMRRSVRREALSLLLELGIVPPEMSPERFRQLVETAQLEEQFKLPSRRPR